jgi:hypothetical protein
VQENQLTRHISSLEFCSDDVASCNNAGTSFTCVVASDAGCTKDVADGKADLTLASADNLVKYG